MFQLRTYQRESVDALFSWFRTRNGNPLLVLPTGAGKSIVQAFFIQEALEQFPRTRIVCVSHVKELLQQNAEKIVFTNPGVDLKFCSAGIGEKRFNAQVLVAGIQTAYKYADRIGHTDLVIVDECHLIPEKSETMYRTFLDDLQKINPRLKVIGLTATPYRLSSGLMYGKDDCFFDGIAHEVPIKELLDQGHLTRLVGRRGLTHVELSGLHTRGGEYIDKELQQRFDVDELTRSIVSEVIVAAEGRKGVLMFSSGVDHAYHLKDAIEAVTGERVEVVSGATNKEDRQRTINDYKAGLFRWLINYGCLTTGFDAPHIDLMVLCRATQSTGLYVQIMGRGMRLCEGKAECIVLDYGGNIERHGPIDKITPRGVESGSGDGEAPIKECPNCLALLYTAIRECPECAHKFPEPEPVLESTASDAAIMSEDAYEWWDVLWMSCSRHQKNGKPDSMKVTYHITETLSVSEWVCFSHVGFARRKAEQWAEKRGVVPPANTEEALRVEWPEVAAVFVDPTGRWPELKSVQFGEAKGQPEPPTPPPFDDSALDEPRHYNPMEIFDDEEIPF